MSTITTNQLGNKYNRKGQQLYHTSKILQVLGIIKRQRKGSRTFNILNTLPETHSAAVQLYHDTFHRTSVGNIISDAVCDLEELYDELDTWRSGMESSEGLMATNKYSMLEDATYCIESAKYALEGEPVPEVLADVPLLDVPAYDIRIRSYRSFGRGRRMANIITSLQSVVDELDQPELDIESKDWLNGIQDAIPELENVIFPGMFD